MEPNKMPVMTLEEIDEQIAALERELQTAINLRLQCEGALNVWRFQRQRMADRLAAIEAVNKQNADAAAEDAPADAGITETVAETPPKE